MIYFMFPRHMFDLSHEYGDLHEYLGLQFHFNLILSKLTSIPFNILTVPLIPKWIEWIAEYELIVINKGHSKSL